MQTFPMVAKTFQGLEDVLSDELRATGAENIEPGVRMVGFEGGLETLYKANLCCRTALSVLKPIEKFTATSPDELYDAVRDFEWEKYMTADSTFVVSSTVNSSLFTNSQFVTYRVKDGIADHFRDIDGRRPSIRLKGADVQLNVHIQEDRVTISLDSSGEPLFKRGYRVEQTEAPINEVLAAGIILKTGWHGECDFADPMCGSGTFLIEAAMIAANVNPGIFREHFAFENWPDFDKELFEEIYNDDSEERDITCRILGGDIDPEAVNIARKNIKAARFDKNISLVCKPMQEWDENDNPGGILVSNPPYGERLRPSDMETLYHQIGETLKFHFQGWNAWILGYKDEHFAAIGLKPSVKIPILNGALECSLREYVLFSGKYSDFRAEGGSVADTKVRKQEERAHNLVHRKSDEEWKRETRSFKPRRTKGDKFEGKDKRKNSDFKKDSKKDFKREFKRDREKDFKKDFKRNNPKDNAGGEKGGIKEVHDRGPRLGEEHITYSSPVHMLTRRKWKKRQETDDNSED